LVTKKMILESLLGNGEEARKDGQKELAAMGKKGTEGRKRNRWFRF